jgi:hypothetical protein
MSDTFLRVVGVLCPCGDDRLVVIVPGCDGFTTDLMSPRRPVIPTRGYCSINHARSAGLPALSCEQR